MRTRPLLLALLVSCTTRSDVRMVAIEVNSVAIQDGRLTESVGFETLGGVFTPVLAPCVLHCEKTEVFSTAADNQSQMSLYVFRGDARLVEKNLPLGTFVITGLPPQPQGTPQVDVTLRADGQQLILLVRDRGGAS